jgi:hypothetical protein
MPEVRPSNLEGGITTEVSLTPETLPVQAEAFYQYALTMRAQTLRREICYTSSVASRLC